MSKRVLTLKNLIKSSIFSRALALATGKSHSEATQFVMQLFSPRNVDHFGVAIAVLGAQKRLNINQVGANDGVTGDRIYKDVLKYAERALLIEPQQWVRLEGYGYICGSANT